MTAARATAGVERDSRPSHEVAPVPSELTKRVGEVLLRYLGASPVLLRGPVSGDGYSVAAADPQLRVDARDVASFLASGLFRLEADDETAAPKATRR